MPPLTRKWRRQRGRRRRFSRNMGAIVEEAAPEIEGDPFPAFRHSVRHGVLYRIRGILPPAPGRTDPLCAEYF